MARANHHYYVYILTNKNKTVLYTGVTNNLEGRLWEHADAVRNNEIKKFTGRYNCDKLVYFECYTDIHTAISREKEIKGWKREKKVLLINSTNPKWKFLEDEIW